MTDEVIAIQRSQGEPANLRDGYLFRVLMKSGAWVTVSAKQLLRYSIFRREVLAQIGQYFEMAGLAGLRPKRQDEVWAQQVGYWLERSAMILRGKTRIRRKTARSPHKLT